MTTRPDDRGPRMPSDPEEVHAAYSEPKRSGGGRQRQSMTETVLKSLLRSLGSSLGRAIMRAIVGRR